MVVSIDVHRLFHMTVAQVLVHVCVRCNLWHGLHLATHMHAYLIMTTYMYIVILIMILIQFLFDVVSMWRSYNIQFLLVFLSC